MTPNLTRDLDTLEAVEDIESTLSWLPLCSRELRRLVDMSGLQCGEGVEVREPAREILCTGANNPCRGWQSKYLWSKFHILLTFIIGRIETFTYY